MRLSPFSPTRLRRRVFGQLWMLGLQFILGMLLNLMNGAWGAGHTTYTLVLILHIVNAVGLLEGGLFIALKASGAVAWSAAAIVLITLSSGVLTVRTGSNLWSFIMAAGFLVASWLYLMLYLGADRKIRNEQG